LYVRIKTISGQRYLYLVEGKRVSGKVEQTTLCYLGPLWKLWAGVPPKTRRKVEARIGKRLDWKSITEIIIKTPILFDELQQLRKYQYSESLYFRKKKRKLPLLPGSRNKREFLKQRAEGELDALARLAALRFAQTFEQIDEKTYRMR